MKLDPVEQPEPRPLDDSMVAAGLSGAYPVRRWRDTEAEQELLQRHGSRIPGELWPGEPGFIDYRNLNTQTEEPTA